MSHPAYLSLIERLREISLLSTINSTLHWDQETYLPPAGTSFRGDQMACLSGRAHRLFTAPEVGDWLKEALTNCQFTQGSTEMVNLHWVQRDYEQATKMPAEFVEECTLAQTLGNQAWAEARKQTDFAIFASHLKKLVSQARQRADYLGYTASRYDALLDRHETGATTEAVGTLLDGLAPALSQLVAEGANACASLPPLLPVGPYPEEAQKLFNAEVAEAMGFDFEWGRVDSTTHPFCTTLGPCDHRITNRYDPADFTSSLYCIMHEAGHALYEVGLPSDQFGLPCGEAVSLGVHESQSRLWENHVGRSLAFWEHWFPRAVAFFPVLRESSPEALWKHVNRIRRSFIRVEADEVTYDLHIILRFRLEKALIEGAIEVDDVPAVWNTLFKELMGLDVDRDSDGCLQDIHWSLGGFGYFATYSLGNINAAQLMEAAEQEIPNYTKDIADGDYRGLLDWLRRQIHTQGKRRLPLDLIHSATGAPVSPEAHLRHLAQKVAIFSKN